MPEILTESFCERCGTRYTFEAQVPKKSSLGKFRTLSKGFKNYVLSDETTLEEAFADARHDEDREITSHQLDAFHKTFNFCMSCRQYTCANCWNEVEARCLSCAPHLGQEILPPAFPHLQSALALSTTEALGTAHPGEVPPAEPRCPTADLAATSAVAEANRIGAARAAAAAQRSSGIFGKSGPGREPAGERMAGAEQEVEWAAPASEAEPEMEAVAASGVEPEIDIEPVVEAPFDIEP